MTNSSQSNASTVATPTVSRDNMVAQLKCDIVSDQIRYVPIGELGTGHRLFHFGPKVTGQKAGEEMAGLGYKHASFADLLAFGIKNPEEQRVHSIVALGSTVELGGMFGGLEAACLCGNQSCRRLTTVTAECTGWEDSRRFLGVLK